MSTVTLKQLEYDIMTTLWSMSKPLVESSVEELQKEIAKRQTWIASIESRLPYADGGAYSQDKDRINQYSQEMRTIHAELRNRNNG